MGQGAMFTLKDSRFTLGIRKKFFNVSMVRNWNKLPRQAVDFTTLEVLKTSLDGALNNEV